ncbi:hypothetical protein GWK47_021566 [Chionoecetes opilio]|uniref:Uncharacterized protein n=1 Tax=Chionoecetes opilio TaxID=41210 RepID=A0A8J4XSY0_CHIOP|nr:hypothetical protein GWK47_021566 [Chionoecetes opilio]
MGAAAGGKNPPRPGRASPSTSGAALSPASFAKDQLVGLVTALGAGHVSSTSIRPQWSGRETTPRVVGAPVTHGGEKLCGGKGGRPKRAFCGALYAPKGGTGDKNLLQAWSAPGGLYPFREKI